MNILYPDCSHILSLQCVNVYYPECVNILNVSCVSRSVCVSFVSRCVKASSQCLTLFHFYFLVLLYFDPVHWVQYYKVPVRKGVKLVEGAVADTCEEEGMRAVCLGDTDCPYTDTTKCDVTRLSSDCEFPM